MPRRTNLAYCGDAAEVLTNHIPDRSIDLMDGIVTERRFINESVCKGRVQR